VNTIRLKEEEWQRNCQITKDSPEGRPKVGIYSNDWIRNNTTVAAYDNLPNARNGCLGILEKDESDEGYSLPLNPRG